MVFAAVQRNICLQQKQNRVFIPAEEVRQRKDVCLRHCHNGSVTKFVIRTNTILVVLSKIVQEATSNETGHRRR